MYGSRVKVSNNIYQLYNEEVGMISGTLGVYILAKVPNMNMKYVYFSRVGISIISSFPFINVREKTSYSKYPDQRLINFTIYVELAY